MATEELNEWTERKPHFNVGLHSLKNIAKGSKTGVARFHITANDKINAGDAYYFNHDDLIDHGHDWDKSHVNGFVKHEPSTGTFKYNMYKDRDTHPQHHILDKMKAMGMQHAPGEALNENKKYLRDIVPLNETLSPALKKVQSSDIIADERENLVEISKRTALSYLNKTQDKPERMFANPDVRLKSYVLAQQKLNQSQAKPKVRATNEDRTEDEYVLFEADNEYNPKKTIKAYKLFNVKGGKLYPLFVNHDKEVPQGKWLHADTGGADPKKPTHVKSKLGPLAMRPGWHSGDLPVATHIGGKSHPSLTKPDYRPEHQKWAEVEHPADHDWQSVANSRGTGKTAHITDQVPNHGHYRYKTNPNMTGNWIISGQMKVNRVLGDDEVEHINKAAGTADLPRLKGKPMKNLREITEAIDYKDNATVLHLKAITKASPYGRARYVIHPTGRMTVGDAYNHDHASLGGGDPKNIEGNVYHDAQGMRFSAFHGDGAKTYKGDHPMFDRFHTHGIHRVIGEAERMDEISAGGIASMRKMITDPSTPHHEREAAKHALSKHGLSHSETPHKSVFDDFHKADASYRKTHDTKRSYKPWSGGATKAKTDSTFKYYNKKAKDYHYEHTHSHMHTDKDDPSGDSDMTVHHYKHFKGHKVELHTKGANGNGDVDHWYHIDPQHKATKGKGFESFSDHLRDAYTKMHEAEAIGGDTFHMDRHKKKKSNIDPNHEPSLTEISREKLSSYRDAADADWSKQGDKAQIANDKIATIPSGNLSARMNAYQARSTAMRQQSRRDKGMQRADRLAGSNEYAAQRAANENYELSEISTGLLAKYAAKAAKNGMNKAYALGQASMSKVPEKSTISTRKVKNRAAGIAKAVQNLASRDFTYSPERDDGDHEYR